MVEFKLRKPMDPLQKSLIPTVYGNVPTFLAVPHVKNREELRGADAAIIGGGYQSFGENPWRSDLGLTFYSLGERVFEILDPMLLRKASVKYGGFLPELGIDVLEHVKLVDYGDVTGISPIITSEDEVKAVQRTVEKIGDVLDAGCIPITIESSMYAVAKAVADRSKGKIGIITLDAHGDNACPQPYAGWVDSVSGIGRIDMRKFVLLGMRGPRNFKEQLNWYHERGSRVYTYREIKKMGIETVTREAVEIAHEKTDEVLLNIDFDVLDLSAAPGLDEPLGIRTEDLLAVVFQVGKSGFKAFNIEWIPQPTVALYHIVTWTTLYLLAGLAVGRRKLDKAV